MEEDKQSFSDWRDKNEQNYEMSDAANPDDLAEGYENSKDKKAS